MSHSLPSLPYSFDALEPYIDARTMEIHHDKHHAGYVNNLNKALEGHPELQKLPVEELLAQIGKVPENIRTAVRNNGGGHLNHSMFWKIMKKGGGGEPSGDIAGAIKSTFGGFAEFKAKFSQAATTRFGSGWAWLLFRGGKAYRRIDREPGQSRPGWRQGGLRHRRLGARLLPEISEPSRRVHRGMVEHDQLGAGSGKLRAGKEVARARRKVETFARPRFAGVPGGPRTDSPGKQP